MGTVCSVTWVGEMVCVGGDVGYFLFSSRGRHTSGALVTGVQTCALPIFDPSGLLERHIPGGRIVGCVVYPAAAVTEPGVVTHVEGDRFPVGELDGSASERVQKLHDLLVEAGFRSRVLDDIRSEIWLKAWGNLSFNPISALTQIGRAHV